MVTISTPAGAARAAAAAARSAATSATRKARRWAERRVRLSLAGKEVNDPPRASWLSSRVEANVDQAKLAVERALVAAVKDIVPTAVQHATALEKDRSCIAGRVAIRTVLNS